VRVSFTREGERYLLSVSDDGVGLPLEDAPASGPRARPLGTGLGTRLLQGLAAQLRGTLSRGRREDGAGTLAELRFPVLQPKR
jgi:two-component sensor histidine kinase